MKNVKSLVIVLMTLLFVCGCSLDSLKDNAKEIIDEITPTVVATDIDETLLSVIDNKLEMYIDEENKIFLKDYINQFDEDMRFPAQVEVPSETEEGATEIQQINEFVASSYVLVDMNLDGTNELVIRSNEYENYCYLVLSYENGKVYAHRIDIRAMQSLKTDGTYIASSGADYNEYCEMSFDGANVIVKTDASSIDGVYTIDEEEVTAEAFQEYITSFDNKADVEWVTK